MNTLLRNFAILTFSFFIFNQAQAYVTVSGNVSGQYWHNTDTYYVTGDLTVDAGTTFEIQAGTRVKFGPSASIERQWNNHLQRELKFQYHLYFQWMIISGRDHYWLRR